MSARRLLTSAGCAAAGCAAVVALGLAPTAGAAPLAGTAPAPASARVAVTPHISSLSADVKMTGSETNRKVRLTIKLNGQVDYNQVVRTPSCASDCTITNLGKSHSPLRVVDLLSDGQPDIVLGLYTGGAHCCFVDEVYTLDPGTTTFVRHEHNFLDAGAVITDLNANGQEEFLSADARIAEAGFTDYADSPAPVQIWTFGGRRFRDVTGQYPSRLKTDAARWMSAFAHHHANGRGMIAAWAADEDRLGNAALVASTLAKQLKRGHLGVPNGFPGPSAQRFVTQLQKLLHRLGDTP